jgi:hypothetical protein
MTLHGEDGESEADTVPDASGATNSSRFHRRALFRSQMEQYVRFR